MQSINWKHCVIEQFRSKEALKLRDFKTRTDGNEGLYFIHNSYPFHAPLEIARTLFVFTERCTSRTIRILWSCHRTSRSVQFERYAVQSWGLQRRRCWEITKGFIRCSAHWFGAWLEGPNGRWIWSPMLSKIPKSLSSVLTNIDVRQSKTSEFQTQAKSFFGFENCSETDCISGAVRSKWTNKPGHQKSHEKSTRARALVRDGFGRTSQRGV